MAEKKKMSYDDISKEVMNSLMEILKKIDSEKDR